MSALNSSISLCFLLLVVVGCGTDDRADQGENGQATVTLHDPALGATSQRQSGSEGQTSNTVPQIETVPVGHKGTPDYTWTMQEVLEAYLTATALNERIRFVVGQDQPDLRTGQLHDTQLSSSLNRSEFHIRPPIKDELFPNESLVVHVDLPNSRAIPYVITRGEKGYRINLSQTVRHRRQVAKEAFIQRYGLRKASLVVKLESFSRNQSDASLKLHVGNHSKADIERFELFVDVHDRNGERLSVMDLQGGPISASETVPVQVTLRDLPAEATACQFRTKRVTMRTHDGVRRDVTNWFVTKPSDK